jgi:glycosyltransferase involved in cell wall biosynthesis
MKSDQSHIAVFVATSGHSGVDRLVRHLVPAIARRNYVVDVLKVRKHGPHFDDIPHSVNIVDMGASHVYSSIPAVIRYLKDIHPVAVLSDKDRVNRTALLAKCLAHVRTRLILSSGTTISIDLASRGAFERRLQRFSMKYLYPYADNVIVTSKGVADDMAAYTGLSRDRIEVVPCPVIPEALFHRQLPPPEHPWFFPGEPPVILGAGELCERKDFGTLIKAFAKVRENRKCRLIILGKGKQEEALIKLAHALRVGNDVDLAGFKVDIYSYMAHASLFAFTSRWEGLGFVLIEALAVGTPVVSTDCPSGPREILADGRYGPLVPVGDAESLAQAIKKTLERPLPPELLQEAARPYEIERSTSSYLQAMGLE